MSALRPPDGPPDGPWFNEIADYLGPAYLRNAFTKGTEPEIGFLADALRLTAGMRVLDVGCGPGRHSLALARRGIEAHGVDLSDEFVSLARSSATTEAVPATFEVGDVRDLRCDREFDAAICLCQGGFGLLGGDDDAAIIERIGRAVRPGGGVALTAFSSYFAVRWLEENEHFDPRTGVLHEIAQLRNEAGEEQPFDLWTTCFTARELALLATAAGLQVDGIHGVKPGQYSRAEPTLEHPELLLLAQRPLGR
jgi:SAM-dependent methyltransferase